MLRDEIFKLAGAVFGGVPAEALELADGGIRIKESPEAFLPFMACGAIINANNAGLPEDLGVTLNCRYVYRPPFQVPDIEKKFGNLTLTYATQIHVAVIEIDPETGLLRHRRLRRRRRLRQAHQPADRRGPGDGRDRAGARRRRCTSSSSTTRTATCLTPNFYDYHVPHALDMPPLRTGFAREPVAVHAARHEGHGRGRRRRHPRRLRGGAGRAARPRRRDRLGQLEPVPPRLGDAERARPRPAGASRWWTHERQRRPHVRGAARARSGRC